MQSTVASPQAYTDLAGLQSISALGRQDSDAALAQVAKQFESILLSQMLKSMRAANDVFAKDGLFSGREMQFRQQMFDQQLGLSLSQGKSMGLAAFIERQMKRQLQGEPPAADEALAGISSSGLRRYTGPVRQAQAVAVPVSGARSNPVETLPARFDSPESFIEGLAPLARRAARRLGVDARVLIAQSALETGWGSAITSDSRQDSYNLFNIKAGSDWSGPTVNVSTVEYRDGLAVREQHRFRVYQNYEESFDDYVNFLSGRPRYQMALREVTQPDRYLRGLQDAGYATDPRYADKVLNIFARADVTSQEP